MGGISIGTSAEGKDVNGRWWKITVTGINNDQTFQADVHDGHGTKWPRVYRTNMRNIQAPQSTSPQLQVLQIKVPQGSGPGDMIQFQTPLGHTMSVKVPPGVVSGQVIAVHVPIQPPPSRQNAQSTQQNQYPESGQSLNSAKKQTDKYSSMYESQYNASPKPSQNYPPTTMPPKQTPQQNSERSSRLQDFIASPMFNGQRHGYVYRNGRGGMG